MLIDELGHGYEEVSVRWMDGVSCRDINYMAL
jgi:hypothetical protein